MSRFVPCGVPAMIISRTIPLIHSPVDRVISQIALSTLSSLVKKFIII